MNCLFSSSSVADKSNCSRARLTMHRGWLHRCVARTAVRKISRGEERRCASVDWIASGDSKRRAGNGLSSRTLLISLDVCKRPSEVVTVGSFNPGDVIVDRRDWSVSSRLCATRLRIASKREGQCVATPVAKQARSCLATEDRYSAITDSVTNLIDDVVRECGSQCSGE